MANDKSLGLYKSRNLGLYKSHRPIQICRSSTLSKLLCYTFQILKMLLRRTCNALCGVGGSSRAAFLSKSLSTKANNIQPLASPYKVVSLKDRWDLVDEFHRLSDGAWDSCKFVLEDKVNLECWELLVETQKEFHLMMLDENDSIAACMSVAPIKYDGELKDLPDGGWDWVVKKALEDFNAGLTPNQLCALQIVIVERGHGLSYAALNEMVILGKEKGFKNILAPVRPTGKHLYPLTDIEEYITWKHDKDESMPFDAWLRVHVRAGGDIIKVCKESMKVEGTLEQWSKWTNLQFQTSGPYVVKEALNPVEFNVEKDLGLYIESNVWVNHTIR